LNRKFTYPITLIPEDKGRYTVRFPDLPEAITQGDNIHDALESAVDCLDEAIANRIVMNLPIPDPSSRGDKYVVLPALMAAKAALYITMRESGTSKVELAKSLGCDEKEIRRLLSPRHPSKIFRIEKALSLLGKQLELTLV